MITTKWATDQSAIRTWPCMNIVIFTHNLGNWLIAAVDVVVGERAETVQREPQDGGEETEGRAWVGAEGAEEGCISSAERGEGYPTNWTSKTLQVCYWTDGSVLSHSRMALLCSALLLLSVLWSFLGWIVLIYKYLITAGIVFSCWHCWLDISNVVLSRIICHLSNSWCFPWRPWAFQWPNWMSLLKMAMKQSLHPKLSQSCCLVEAKLIHAVPAWSGFCSAGDHVRLNVFLHRCTKLG